MRKMFTRLFGLTLLMYLASSLTVVKAQCTLDLDPITDANVVLLTDISTVCDGGNVQYMVTGYESDSTYYSFNGEGDDTGAGFTLANTFTTVEGRPFVVQVRVGSSCLTNVHTYVPTESVVAMTLDTILVTHPRCAGDDGEITVEVGGTEDFVVYYVDSASVAWDPNGTYPAHDETQFLGIPGHKYYMGISSVNCTSVMWDSITVADAPTALEVADVNGVDPECIGGEGTVTVTGIAGGTPFIGGNYMVTVGDSTKLSNGATAMFMMPQGNYTATVVDSFGCELTSDSIAVLTDPAAITFDIEIVDVDCYGSTGEIHVVNMTGPAGAAFAASLGDGNWVAAVNDTIKFTGLTPAYYSVYVDNTNDACDSVRYVNPNNTQNTVSVMAPGLIEFDVAVGTITCNGGTTTIAVSNEEGGSGTYEYQLSDVNGVVHAFSSTNTWNDVPAGVGYVVTVRDANATTCEISSVEYDITEPTLVSVYAETVSPTCPGGNDGLIEITANGGNGTYEYSLNGTTWYTNNIFTKEAGVYTVWARDPLCLDQKVSTTVEVDALDENVIELLFGQGWTDTVNQCYGVNDNAIVVGKDSWASQVGETRDLTVLISNGTDTMEMTQGWLGNWRADDVDPGTYTIWAFDELGCGSNKLEVNVVEVDMLTIEAYVSDNATCYGDNDGVITVKNNGGGNDEWYGYFHTNTLQAAMNLDEDAFITWPEGADSVEVQATKGTYYVVVMDECGYRAYAGPFTVDGLDPVEIDEDAVSVKHIKCFGDTDGEIVVANATGGSGSLVYTLEVKNGEVWEEVEEWVETDATHYTGLGKGTYRVVVTDENGCAGATTGDIIVEGPAAAVTIVDYDSEQISCFGAADGEIYIEAAGGTGPYQFKAGASNWRDFPANSNERTINILEPGTYTVTIRDAEMCESDPMEFTIYEPEEIQIDVQITDVTNTCDAANGQFVITVTGGEYASNESDFNVYVNGNEEGYHVEANEPVTVTGLGAGSYQIMVKENHTEYGCEQYATAVISAPDTVFAVAEVTQTVSCNGGNDGEIVVSGMSGGTVADDYTVTISPSMGAVATTDTTVAFSGLEAGLYDITVTDDQGCSYTMYDVAVVEPTMLTLNATKIQDITCAEGGMFSVQVSGGTADYVYYTAKSNPATGHVFVTDIPTPTSNWQADSIFTVTEAGTWIVWAMDANQCIIGGEEDEFGPVNEWRVKVEALGTPDVSFTDLEVIANDYCGDTTGVIGFSAVEFSFDGVPYATTYTVEYQEGIWNSTTDSYVAGDKFASDSDTVSALPYRGYRFVLTDNTTGCTVTSEWLTVDGNAPMVVTLEKGDGEFACPDATDGFIEATVVSGGEAPYTYILYQDGDSVNTYTENAFLVPINSSYYVVVKDANDCMMASEALVLDPVAPVVIEEIKDVTCSDDALASLKVTVSGEEGRQFEVKWRLYEETTEYTTAGMFDAGDIYLNEMFLFDNENVQDKHYEIVVVDDMGCMSAMDTVTIDQKPGSSIMLTTTVGEVNGCGTEVMVVAAGGVAPYSYMVNGEVAEGTTLLLGGGTHIIQAMDAHECMDADTITLAYPMSVDTTFNIFVGDTAHLVYGTIDEMFTEDVTATFYDMSDENCTVEVNVEVITREKTAPVLDTVSPMGTITDNHPTFVITFADDVTFNETGVLTVTEKDSANATLTLNITAEMVSGNTVTVTYDHTVSGGLDKYTTYVVAVDSGVVMGDGLVWDGKVPYAWEFTTGDFATGITPDVETVEFKVYPNPFSNFIRIDNAQKLDRVIVSNIAGQRVLDIENPTYEIRTGNLVTGVYVVTLIANDEIVKSERIIKR